ncbi:amino acid adenylation domain-containing protein [Dictyobacter formicarum]|uniref:D-alanine--poly(Phosphoribitol) ligase n=1 Tax=Dictyobacter formicarum TaxID=2778368 RepID=A0ABQ3VX41_9CHLR|nr:amino acid adenylation domain-containing protein [Dictyobacter formicarum]GHO89861.1 D-alanine--poly(phosphoribitol) ligase [Dictyobacter formicarum]
MKNLVDLVIHNATQSQDAVAINAIDGIVTYGALDNLANQFARGLTRLGVQRGDRVGIWLEKSTYTIAAMQGVLRLGAVYVPLDPLSPPSRISTIINDCTIHVLITMQQRASGLRATADLPLLTCLCLDSPEDDSNWEWLQTFSTTPYKTVPTAENDMAYILYTSGSTGKPKGVCISHKNALAFVEWAVSELDITPYDNLANHAPFHFDLSVFDIYAAFYRGATVCLIPDGFSYIPHRLVRFLVNEAITIWYSVPSVLILMMEQGGWLDITHHSLRAILFAGEPFAVKQVQRLNKRWPELDLLNLYGPTETNVCTFYAISRTQLEQNTPLPIGQACSGDTVWAQKEDGSVAGPGEEGELMVKGPTVMIGYWNQPVHGNQPYATGDRVRLEKDGNYFYLGRRDQMLKVRGHRIEPGDIEAILEQHPQIHTAAVVVTGSGLDARLMAFIVFDTPQAPSLLEIKRFCSERLPRYMIIDVLTVLPELPRTRNGKIDRLALMQVAQKHKG